jgi:hypothetical protein
VFSTVRFCRGGALLLGAGGRITQCAFYGNLARGEKDYGYGGAIYMTQDNTVTNCIFIANEAMMVNGPGFGGAIFAEAGGSIESSTFVGNRASGPFGVGGIHMDGGGSIRNSILAYTGGAACAGTPGPTWSCSALFGNSSDGICGTDAGGNFSADPQFCAADPVKSAVVELQSDSPCAAGNHPEGTSCGLVGAGAVACASVSITPATWSAVKRLYR